MSAAPSVPTELAQHRARLLADVPVTERQVDVAQISTAVLEAGDGPPVILLHGPGETAVNWRWTIPDLAVTHRAIAPDLPAHGGSGTGETPLDADVAVRWLTELVERPRPRRAGPTDGGRGMAGLRCLQRRPGSG